jgi:hypothetical protein
MVWTAPPCCSKNGSTAVFSMSPPEGLRIESIAQASLRQGTLATALFQRPTASTEH